MSPRERKERIYALTLELSMLLKQELDAPDTIVDSLGQEWAVADDGLTAWPIWLSEEEAIGRGLIVNATIEPEDPQQLSVFRAMEDI